MRYDLEKRGNTPLYLYLYECIRGDILNGVLPAGTRLPSKRNFAADQGIAVITAENAYAQLLSEGYITSRSRSGFYVSEISEGADLSQAFRQASGAVSAPSAESDSNSSMVAVSGSAEKTRSAKKQPAESFIDFTSGRLHADAFPFSTWSKLLRRILADQEGNFLQAAPSMGIPELQEAIAAYLLQAKGLYVQPSHIFIGPGTEYLHSVVLQLLGGAAITAVEDPGYKKIGQLYEGAGHKCVHIPVDEKGLRVDLLYGSNIRLLHTSPSHHFPTGCVMPVGRRSKLLAWAASEDAYIIEDDYDSEFRFNGKPIPPLSVLDSERVIYMNTFTKTLAPSIRIAYMVLPDALLSIYKNKLSYYSSAVSAFEQYTLAAFIREGYYERHIARMRNFYRKERRMILDAIAASPLSEYAVIEEENAGLHFVLRLPAVSNDQTFTEKLRSEKIRLSSLSDYAYHDRSEYHHRFLISYASLTEEELKKALPVMVRALRSQSRK